MVKFIVVLITSAFLLSGCGGGSSGGSKSSAATNADFSTGGTVELDDGVVLRIQEGSGDNKALITATSSGEPGALIGASQVVSAEFQLESENLKRGDLTAPILVSLPVSSLFVDADADPMSFDIQIFNTETSSWDWVDGWAFYDADTQDVSFWTGHFSRYRVLHSEPDDRDNYERYRVNSRNFAVIYYEPDYAAFGVEYPYAAPKDSIWDPLGGNTNTSADIPNYIEDLDEALEDALTYYLGMTTTSGTKLFDASTERMEAYVTYLPKKDSSGDSKFSIMRIATSLENYSDMAKTATHELAHVMSNQYYSVYGAAYNRWFFEATADLWTSRALGMTRDEQKNFFSRTMATYLKVPLDSSDEGSYYAAADFLNWLEQATGKYIAADVVAADYAKDLSGLSALTNSGSTNLSDYYIEYVLQASVGEHDLNVPLVERVKVLDKNAAGFREQLDIPHLSARGFGIRGNFAAEGLLVVSAEKADSGTDIQTFSYISRGIPVDDIADYEEATLDKDASIVIENFGEIGSASANNILYQIAINPTLADSDNIAYTFESYVLVPPLVQLSEGLVDFTSGAQYPANLSPVLGYNVYLTGQKLNAGFLAADAHQFKHVSIHSSSDVVVTVVDTQGNEWPKVENTIASNWEMQIDLFASTEDINRCSRSETSVASISSVWIPVSVTSDGKASFDYDWLDASDNSKNLHINGSGTFDNKTLRVNGSWTLNQSQTMVLGSIEGYEKGNVGTFTLGGHFIIGSFFHDSSAISAEASADYTKFGYSWDGNEYYAEDPVNYSCNDQHPKIDITEFRQK